MVKVNLKSNLIIYKRVRLAGYKEESLSLSLGDKEEWVYSVERQLCLVQG